MKKIYVTIKGQSGAMKSPIAMLIERSIKSKRKDLSCTIFDHQLFTDDEHFEESLLRVREEAASSNCDVIVFVINTGIDDDNNELSIEIEPAIPGVSMIFNAITDFLCSAE